MEMTQEAYLAHYGILRRSGRYPWGSGGTQSKRNKQFLDVIEEHRRAGMSDVDIARAYGMTTTQLRALKSIAKNEQKQQQINMAQRLHDKGMSNGAIAERMGLAGESSVRALLAPGAKDRADILESTSEMLKREVEEKGFIDVGTDVYRNLPIDGNPNALIGISSTQFNTAVARLEEQGYVVRKIRQPQSGNNQFTTMKVMAKPGTKYREFYENQDKIRQISEKSDDHGRTFDAPKAPLTVSPNRVGIRYAEDGGNQADGVIYVRPGVNDLSMGRSNYSQVRVKVGDNHYLKGMAVYKDDLPPGVDLLFNTNKSNTGNKLDAMKKISDDPDLPFSSVVRQVKDKDGNDVISALNIVNERGVDWDNWSRNLPSQMLSKQSPALIKQQLEITQDRRRRELDEISALTNPVVRRKLLDSYADDADSASVHLKAAAMPRQRTKVLLPIKSIKENEIYAPSLLNGERVALVRFPHGGKFEIPQVTVNNRNSEARKLIGPDAPDAIGIHWRVAERLSGADFDGDTVLAIPNARGSIKSDPPLKGLKGFDPKGAYKPYDGMPTIDGGRYNAKTRQVEYKGKKNPARMQQEMGKVSNLITDMTLRGASSDELARAVRHSMVIIDAEKHGLDFRSSEKDNGIAALKEKYQDTSGRKKGGASTLISRAGSEQRVPAFKPRPAKEGGPIDRATGKKVFVPTGETYVNKRGQTVPVTRAVRKLDWVDDAHTLSSGTIRESIYADHSNRLKGMANEARRKSVNTKPIPYSPSAKKAYVQEVGSLNSKLNVALKNAPLERQALVIANAKVAQKKKANPELTNSDLKKLKAKHLAEARVRTGAKKHRIVLTPSEWAAIQAGAISTNKLNRILDNADIDQVKQLATPRTKKLMTSQYKARAIAMLAQGFTQAEVADQLGVSLTTLKESL